MPSHWYGARERFPVHDDRGRPEAVLAVLADPPAHADIDGTGWVGGSMDGDRITAAGQVFRMAMYHDGHPGKEYKIANLVEVFDEPRAIAWRPGTESPETGSSASAVGSSATTSRRPARRGRR